MGRWQCKNCAAVIDNHNISRPEDVIKEIPANKASPCPVCDQAAGFDNLDLASIIVPWSKSDPTIN